MAITFVAESHDDHDAISASVSVAVPTGTQGGDFLLLRIEGIGSSLSVTSAPSGWTLEQSETGNANILSVLYSKYAGGTIGSATSDTGPYTATLSNSIKQHSQVTAYRGVDQTTAINAKAHGTAGLNVTTSTPSVTSTATNCWCDYSVFGRHTFTGAAHTNSTSDGSDAELHDHGSNAGTGFDVMYAAYNSNRDLTTGAHAPTVTASASENAIAWHAVMLNPAASGTPLARLYGTQLDAGSSAPPLRARLYGTLLESDAPAGGKLANVYGVSLTAPLPAGHTGDSGVFVLMDGAWTVVELFTLQGGEW